MESFNDKDGLDKFLRSTFEGAEDQPGSDLWERIESDLDDTAVKKQPAILWWLLATVIVLLTLLVVQQIYFQNKVNALQADVDNNASSKQEEMSITGNANDSPVKEGQEAALAPVVEENHSENNIPRSSNKTKRPNGNEVFLRPQIAGDEVVNIAEVEESSFQENTVEKPSLKKPVAEPGVLENTIVSSRKSQKTGDEKTGILHNDIDDKINVDYRNRPADKRIAFIDYQSDNLTVVSPQTKSETSADAFAVKLSSQTVKTDNRQGSVQWELGGFAQIATTNLSLSAASISRPVNRAIFVQQEQESGSTQWYGLQVKALIGNNFTLESGLAYRQTDLQVGHKASINYGERLRMNPPDWPGRDSSLADFRYNLPTASGAYEVTVRASDVDQRGPIRDTDVLLFNQVVSEKTSYLSIPVAIGYQQAFGKFRISGAAGIWTNFLLKNEVELLRMESLNRRFSVSRRLARPGFVKNDLRRVTLDYSLEASLAFEFAPGFSAYAGPVWTGSIYQKNKNPLIQSSLQSLGGKAGFLLRI